MGGRLTLVCVVLLGIPVYCVLVLFGYGPLIHYQHYQIKKIQVPLGWIKGGEKISLDSIWEILALPKYFGG